MKPFLILSLPRSGTAWLANWLTNGNVRCEHELFAEPWVRSAKDVAGWLTTGGDQIRGNSDSGNVWYVKQLVELLPDLTVVAVTRPVDCVIDSLFKVLPSYLQDTKEKRSLIVSNILDHDARLKAVIKEYDILPETFEDLLCPSTGDGELAGQRIWFRVGGGGQFNFERWSFLRRMNVQLTRGALLGVAHRALEMQPLWESRDKV